MADRFGTTTTFGAIISTNGTEVLDDVDDDDGGGGGEEDKVDDDECDEPGGDTA